jgi:hypothetical protein
MLQVAPLVKRGKFYAKNNRLSECLCADGILSSLHRGGKLV